MIKRVICLAAVFCLIFTLCGCSSQQNQKIPPAPTNESTREAEEIAQQVDEILLNMTLKEKAAQMLVVEVNQTGVLNSPAPGGVIFFSENFTTAAATKELIATLKSQSKVPLIVSVDQEGGRVQRLSSLKSPAATYIPPMYNLGKTDDTALAQQVGNIMAVEMGALGINVTFAPVLDVYSNPHNTVIGNRSFGENPHSVANMAISLANGLYEKGVMPVYKHFPGHGDTAVDSHVALPIISKTKAQLNATELVPFKAAIENGAQMIMVGHIALPKFTGDNTPATLSGKIITDLLKNEMGFTGLVITDSLKMKALTNNYSEEEIYQKAVEAGVDILLMPPNPQLAIKVITESFTAERIDQSVRKILTYKLKNLANLPEYELSNIGEIRHKEIIDKIP